MASPRPRERRLPGNTGTHSLPMWPQGPRHNERPNVGHSLRASCQRPLGTGPSPPQTQAHSEGTAPPALSWGTQRTAGHSAEVSLARQGLPAPSCPGSGQVCRKRKKRLPTGEWGRMRGGRWEDRAASLQPRITTQRVSKLIMIMGSTSGASLAAVAKEIRQVAGPQPQIQAKSQGGGGEDPQSPGTHH